MSATSKPSTAEGVKLTKADHPLTPVLEREDERGVYVQKRHVRKMNGYTRYLRPFWKGTWSCWCVQDGGPQPIFWDEANREFTVTDPAGRQALEASRG
jgi:hypothetical protein